MKKNIVVLGSILALSLSACLPIFTPTPKSGPTIDAAGTSDTLFKTAVAQTLTARPSSTATAVPVTDTAVVAVATSTLPATDTPAPTFTPVGGFPTPGATMTANVPTATGAPANVTGTATTTLAAGQITAIWTLAIRKYGTLPPAIPFTYLTLVNKTKAEAYISLQVNMPNGEYTVIEYPVKGTIKIQAPVGSYLYVVWIGGNKMVGNFRLHQEDEFSILLYTDKVVIK